MLPIVLTKKQKALIVGAGCACAIKLKVLSRIDCDITIVSDKFDYNLGDAIYTKLQKDFYSLDESFFEDFDLIYIGIELQDTSMIEKLVNTKLVNVLSNPDLSNFIHPCTRDDGDVLVSVNNINERNPKKACKWADDFVEYKKELCQQN
ncbi:MAG: NAD(P)-dependent oxidoreductase [Campylobacterota bacterium]|nr:NAD(P)-dependent oxidoreductase [Campylobacterota bacterium]